MQPSDAIVNAGTKQQFTAVGLDQHGNEILGLAFIWEAAGGNVDRTGLFTAVGHGGLHEITASAKSKNGIADGSTMVVIPPNFRDFRSIVGLNLVLDAKQSFDVLRLTPSKREQAGAAWFTAKLMVLNGFETTFQFQVPPPGRADGFAFVIQNWSDSAIGSWGGESWLWRYS